MKLVLSLPNGVILLTSGRRVIALPVIDLWYLTAYQGMLVSQDPDTHFSVPSPSCSPYPKLPPTHRLPVPQLPVLITSYSVLLAPVSLCALFSILCQFPHPPAMFSPPLSLSQLQMPLAVLMSIIRTSPQPYEV